MMTAQSGPTAAKPVQDVATSVAQELGRTDGSAIWKETRESVVEELGRTFDLAPREASEALT